MPTSTESRLAVLETQMDRFCSDMESEKRSRAEAHAEHTKRIDKVHERLGGVEKMIAIGVGILMALQFVIKFIPTTTIK